MFATQESNQTGSVAARYCSICSIENLFSLLSYFDISMIMLTSKADVRKDKIITQTKSISKASLLVFKAIVVTLLLA